MYHSHCTTVCIPSFSFCVLLPLVSTKVDNTALHTPGQCSAAVLHCSPYSEGAVFLYQFLSNFLCLIYLCWVVWLIFQSLYLVTKPIMLQLYFWPLCTGLGSVVASFKNHLTAVVECALTNSDFFFFWSQVVWEFLLSSLIAYKKGDFGTLTIV